MIVDNLQTLPSAPDSGDEIVVERGIIAYKIDYDALATAILGKLGGDPVTLAHGGTGAVTAANARSSLSVYSKAEATALIGKALKVDCGTVSSLPKTITNSAITTEMSVVHSIMGTPSAMTSDWTVTTVNGSLTISGSISGSTSLILYLERS